MVDHTAARYELTDEERLELERWFAEVNTLNEHLNDADDRDVEIDEAA